MTTWITICDTCKRDGWSAEDDSATQAFTDGEKLAALIEAAAKSAAPPLPVKTRRHSCLMGCARACNVTIQGAGKIAYTLGDFQPDDAVATAILAYAQLHASSATGQVPYRDWPQAVKGHFVTRHPPLPDQE